MNDIFQYLQRRYVLVFFDDIIVYSINWNDHLSHLANILGTLMKNQLLVNQSKCLIGQLEVQN